MQPRRHSEDNETVMDHGGETYCPRRVLVTGAAGFIGAHLCNRLVEELPQLSNHTLVVGLDRMDYCASKKSLAFAMSCTNFKLVEGSITHSGLVHHILNDSCIDTVIHLAAQTHVDHSFGSSFSFTESNVYGTHVMLECASAVGTVQRFVHVSTDEVYGECGVTATGESIPSFTGSTEAHTTLQPTNPYSATKAAAEMLVKAYGCSYGLPAIITRGNNVFGPKQFPDKLVCALLFVCALSAALSFCLSRKGPIDPMYMLLLAVMEMNGSSIIFKYVPAHGFSGAQICSTCVPWSQASSSWQW